jgi:hypothetical protein
LFIFRRRYWPLICLSVVGACGLARKAARQKFIY